MKITVTYTKPHTRISFRKEHAQSVIGFNIGTYYPGQDYLTNEQIDGIVCDVKRSQGLTGAERLLLTRCAVQTNRYLKEMV